MTSSPQPKLSSRNPTLKRVLKEAAELASQPSPDYHAAPLETDLFEWHFTLRGAPAPSPFEKGAYHGRIVLPPAYPLKPPSFRFLTPTGRFEVNREICLSISGHHEETWQPAWGIRTALVALRSFMDTDAKGQLGGMEASEETRRRWAAQSPGWKCPVCAKCNGEILKEQEGLAESAGGDQVEDTVPDELRLGYREDVEKKEVGETTEKTVNADQSRSGEAVSNGALSATAEKDAAASQTPSTQPEMMANAQRHTSTPAPTRTVASAQTPATPQPQQRQAQAQARQAQGVPEWIDKAIIGILLAIAFLLWQRFI